MRTRPTRRTRALALALIPLLALTAAVSACGDSGGSGDGGAAPPEDTLEEVPDSEFEDETGSAQVEVRAVDNRFEPQYVTVSPGTAVTFVNDGRNIHNVLPAEDGAFEDVPADEFGPDASATLTFDEPGTYAYYCSLHGSATRGMTGRIVVVDDGGA